MRRVQFVVVASVGGLVGRLGRYFGEKLHLLGRECAEWESESYGRCCVKPRRTGTGQGADCYGAAGPAETSTEATALTSTSLTALDCPEGCRRPPVTVSASTGGLGRLDDRVEASGCLISVTRLQRSECRVRNPALSLRPHNLGRLDLGREDVGGGFGAQVVPEPGYPRLCVGGDCGWILFFAG